jgi:hypothetical protein
LSVTQPSVFQPDVSPPLLEAADDVIVEIMEEDVAELVPDEVVEFPARDNDEEL